MSTLTTPSSPKSQSISRWFIIFCFALLSAYPIYKNFYYGRAVTTYERHQALLRGESEYFNPWQYRVFSPMLVESVKWVYDHTVDKIFSIDKKLQVKLDSSYNPTPETVEFVEMLQQPEGPKYLVVFVLLRFLIDFLALCLAFKLWNYFVRNRWLSLTGIVLLSLAMGNGVLASDLTFNTYLDICFYLTAGLLIVKRKPGYWFLPLVLIAALNRETSMLIPFLYFISNIKFPEDYSLRKPFGFGWPPKQVWLLTAVMYVIFFAVFIGVRMYYGYQSPQVWKAHPGWPMIKLNLLSGNAIKSLFELLGVVSIIPLMILYNFKKFPLLQRVWFVGIVPAWFAVHIYSVVIYQTRLFLAPLALILIPMLLVLIEKQYEKKNEPVMGSSGV